MPRKKTGAIREPRQIRPGFRNADDVQSVVMRMGRGYVDALDELCEVNNRSRRELVEILIAEASMEYKHDPSARILPL